MAQQDARLRIIETGARDIAEEMIRADHAYSERVFESLPADRQEELIEITASNLVEAAKICEMPVGELAWIVNFWALFLESQGVTMKSMGFGDGITIHRQMFITLIPLGLAMAPDQNCEDGIAGAAASYGLSPRVRGNRATICTWSLIHGSIPACAGEPSCRTTSAR